MEWIWPARGRGRTWRWLEGLLRKFRRWQRMRARRLRLVRERQKLLRGTPQAKLLAGEKPAAEPEKVCPVPPSTGQAVSVVEKAQDTEESPALPARRGPGRPRTIPTDHICCPYEGCTAHGRPGSHPAHDIVGRGTYTTAHGERRQLYQCLVCGRSFSETAGTVFFGLKVPSRTVCIALQELAEGLGIRAVARIHGVKPDMVLNWLRRAGEHSAQLSAYMLHDLELEQVQVDELWTFVRKKERVLSEWEKLHTNWGDTWIWVAFDPIHKLVVAVLGVSARKKMP